ncbi:hypothetical protein JL722_11648 [Aureococcus anophagefferens]|nr:hypothetical protein JL722_11648 [Aureococcus anophagefferens]
MPWRPPYEDVNATFAPTYNVDDDAVLLSNLLEQLTLADVIQGEVEAVSKRHGGDYAAQPRRRVGEVRTFDWVRATLFERTDADVLKHAGLEMYVYLRFVRLCLRLCVFGSCVCAPVLCTAYSTAASHYGYGRFSWYRYTIANIAEHRPGQDKGDSTHHRSRLWMPAVFMALLTAHAVTACYNECAALVELRQDFFTTAPKNADPSAAGALSRVPRRELTPCFRRVAAALDLTRLERGEAVALHLERLLLKRSRTDREPLVGDSAYPLERLCPAWLRPRSACCAISPGADLDAASAKEQIIPLLRGRLAGQNAAFADVRRRTLEDLERADAVLSRGARTFAAPAPARRERAPRVRRAVVGYVTTLGPVGLVSIALAVMPISLENVAKKYERRKLKSSAQLSVLHRNFLLQMINLWFTVSVYFVELILIKTLVGLLFELSRVAPWLRLRGIRLAAGGALTPRDRKSALFLRPEFPYGNVYTTTLMVLVMAFLFAVIAPLIFPFAACFFAAAYLVYSHNAMHVYVPQYETGGIFFFPAMRRFLGALVATQLTLVAYLMLKRAWGAAG